MARTYENLQIGLSECGPIPGPKTNLRALEFLGISGATGVGISHVSVLPSKRRGCRSTRTPSKLSGTVVSPRRGPVPSALSAAPYVPAREGTEVAGTALRETCHRTNLRHAARHGVHSRIPGLSLFPIDLANMLICLGFDGSRAVPAVARPSRKNPPLPATPATHETRAGHLA